MSIANRPSSSVTNRKGMEIQKKFFKELAHKLEQIAPGSVSNI